nr:hypothetical protein [Tanacetum cinerariifolium]
VEDTVEPEDETVLASVYEVGDSSTTPFFREDSDGLFLGLTRRDINSLFGRMTSLSRRLCGHEMAYALIKKNGKEKDEYYGKLILDLGNEVRSSVKEGTATMENMVRKLCNTEERAECKKLKMELKEARFSNTLLRMQNERVKRDLYWTRVRAHEFYRQMIRRRFLYEERPNEAIDVPVEDEKSPSFEPRGSPRDQGVEDRSEESHEILLYQLELMHVDFRDFCSDLECGIARRQLESIQCTLKFVSKTKDYQKYGALIPDGMINQDIMLSTAYKTYLDYATGKVPPNKARKFKKLASPKLKIVSASPKEPTQKGKQVKRAVKKATTASTTSVVIRDTPEVPNELVGKTKDTSERTGVKTRVLDMSKEDSLDSNDDSLGDSEDEKDDDVAKELYGYLNITQGLRDTYMTNVEQGGEYQQNASHELGFVQEEEDAHVTLITVHDKTEGPLQSSSISSDFTIKLLNLNDLSSDINSLMNTLTVPPPPLPVNPSSHPTTIPWQQTPDSTTTTYPIMTLLEIPNFASSFIVRVRIEEFDKMENNESINRSNVQRNLYNALVESYNTYKDILFTYGDVVTLKSKRDDQDKDEDPSAGSDRWKKNNKEGDFQRLNMFDIKDTLLLLVQKKLSNLNVEDRYDLGVALRLFTRRIVILRRVKDLQLGVESYQKNLNITCWNQDMDSTRDTTGSKGKKVMNALSFYKMETDELSERYIAPCFVNGLEAYNGEINLAFDENLISNELFMRLAKGIVDFENGVITIYPTPDPFEDDFEKTEKSPDDWDQLLELDFNDVLMFGEELPPLVCKMGKSSRNKKRSMENSSSFYQDIRPSLSAGDHLTQKEKEEAKEALAIRISQKFALLEEVRPVIETMAYHEKYKKILDGIWKDKVELDGKIIKEEEEVVERIKGERRSISIHFPPKIRKKGREEMKKVDRGIMMINHTQAKAMGILTNVLCQVGVTTIIAKFIILDIPIDRDAPIVVGQGIPVYHRDDEEEYQIKRNMFRASIYGPKPVPYQNCNDPTDRSLAIQTTMRTHDDEVESLRSKCSRQHETMEEVLLPQVHHEFLLWEGCSREAKMRCDGEIDDMLRIRLREAGSDEDIFTSIAWIRDFNINEPIYTELCHKFYSTYKFDEVCIDDELQTKKIIKFRLGGRAHSLTLLGFARRLGLYQATELDEEGFNVYFEGGLHSDEHFNAQEYWLSISREENLSLSRSYVSTIKYLVLRVIHKMITYGLCQRTIGYDKIQKNDLRLLSMFHARHQNRYANVAWLITRWMKRKGAGTQKESQICCGQFISKIARKSRMLIDDVLRSLSAPVYYRDLDTTTLRELIDSESRLIPEDLQLGVPRVGIPRPLRASMQDLYVRMGRMEIRQEAIEGWSIDRHITRTCTREYLSTWLGFTVFHCREPTTYLIMLSPSTISIISSTNLRHHNIHHGISSSRMMMSSVETTRVDCVTVLFGS